MDIRESWTSRLRGVWKLFLLEHVDFLVMAVSEFLWGVLKLALMRNEPVCAMLPAAPGSGWAILINVGQGPQLNATVPPVGITLIEQAGVRGQEVLSFFGAG